MQYNVIAIIFLPPGGAALAGSPGRGGGGEPPWHVHGFLRY